MIEEAQTAFIPDTPRLLGASLTVFGVAGGDALAAAAAGDFDDDGITDLALGAPGALLGDGRIVVLPGPVGPDGGASPGIEIAGETSSRTGTALAAADLTGDGVDDLAVASDFGVSIVEGGAGIFDFGGFPVPVALDGGDFFAAF